MGAVEEAGWTVQVMGASLEKAEKDGVIKADDECGWRQRRRFAVVGDGWEAVQVGRAGARLSSMLWWCTTQATNEFFSYYMVSISEFTNKFLVHPGASAPR